MQFHKVCEIFPKMSAEEFSGLKEDIATNGLLEPIWIHEDQIIDGRNRYLACLEIGIEPEYRPWSGEGSLTSFVLSLNLNRRHLSASQKATVAIEVEALFAEEAKERQRKAGGDRKSENYQKSVHPILGEPIEDPLPQATKQVAQAVGVSHGYISEAKKLHRETPDVFPLVASGHIDIPQAKAMAKLPEDRRTEAISLIEQGADPKEVTRQAVREIRVEKIASISEGNSDLPISKKYPVIYADPPWQYEHVKTNNRAIENHYPTMTLEDIKSLPVSDIATPDAVLFLWTTAPKMEEAIAVINAWGFTYRTQAIWDKGKIGMGYYFRVQHEILCVAIRGQMVTPEPSNRVSSVIREPPGKHSEKPKIMYEIIEEMYGEFSKIELFCRSPQKGWDKWGNQA